MNLLIVDDEDGLRRTLRLTLESMSHHVREARSSDEALAVLAQESPDFAFLDLRLGRDSLSGLDLLPKMLQVSPGLGVVIMTAYAGIDTAVDAIKRGAYDYLPKPFTPKQLRMVLDRWNDYRGLRTAVMELRNQVQSSAPGPELTTREPLMQAAWDLAFRVAATDATILIRGESGTGKGVMAQAIHQRGLRCGKPLVTVSCPSLSAELLESDLFGHARGAFTGALRATEGKVTVAEGGTLFLDEIGDLPLPLQPKLLRFLQEKRYERIGETQTRIGDVRFITATNHDLLQDVRIGRFREDLYYRLNVVEIIVPPLRERMRDLPALCQGLLQFFSDQMRKTVVGFSDDAMSAIANYRWPGNIRELRNAVERAVILTNDSWIRREHLPLPLAAPAPAGTFNATGVIRVGDPVSLELLEKEHVRAILALSASLEDAASILNIDPSTLYRKRKKLGL